MSGQPASHRRNRLHLLPALACAALLSACQQGAQQPEAPAPPAPTPPMAQETPPPDYPPELACRQVGGTALLNVALAANGYAVKVEIVSSSGNATLDEAAVAAVREWKFRPATVRGQPTTSKLQVPVKFTPPNPPPDECNQYL
ncbi:energy transducer TonB [Lysobacter solisilvae (ex Woo and Kim 2020)]|uniref:Energy transducer TonB n=1 Tax=Agrilutibacter terrestris TaxID=2865112 RepID=A0A7H0FX61_9GAMM|nr:energy transducer TonB [Lysobacter terrestris]QNP40627.1 energy transducer TonB [Lysobacter terrestris]